MHSIENYLRRRSTEQLELILRTVSVDGQEYPPELILLVYTILAERNALDIDAEKMYQQFLCEYARKKEDL